MSLHEDIQLQAATIQRGTCLRRCWVPQGNITARSTKKLSTLSPAVSVARWLVGISFSIAMQVEIEPNSPPGVRRRSFEFSSSRRAASPGSTKSSSMESAGLQQSGSLRRSSSLERLPTPSLGEPLPGMEVSTVAVELQMRC